MKLFMDYSWFFFFCNICYLIQIIQEWKEKNTNKQTKALRTVGKNKYPLELALRFLIFTHCLSISSGTFQRFHLFYWFGCKSIGSYFLSHILSLRQCFFSSLQLVSLIKGLVCFLLKLWWFLFSPLVFKQPEREIEWRKVWLFEVHTCTHAEVSWSGPKNILRDCNQIISTSVGWYDGISAI